MNHIDGMDLTYTQWAAAIIAGQLAAARPLDHPARTACDAVALATALAERLAASFAKQAPEPSPIPDRMPSVPTYDTLSLLSEYEAHG